VVVVHLQLDPSSYDKLMVTEELEGVVPSTPGTTKWESAPQLAAAS